MIKLVHISLYAIQHDAHPFSLLLSIQYIINNLHIHSKNNIKLAHTDIKYVYKDGVFIYKNTTGKNVCLTNSVLVENYMKTTYLNH